MITQHSKPWPLLIAVSAAALFIAATLVTSYFRPGAIDPRVTMEFGEDASIKQTAAGQSVIASTIDGEVARTAERLGEATALALSASLYAANEEIKGRAPRSARDLLGGIATQNLLPPGRRSLKAAALSPHTALFLSGIARRRSESKSFLSAINRKTALR